MRDKYDKSLAMLAQRRLAERFGTNGLQVLSPAVLEQLLLGEVARLLLSQVSEEFEAARDFITCAMSWGAGN